MTSEYNFIREIYSRSGIRSHLFHLGVHTYYVITFVERDSFIGLLVGSWEVLKLQPTFQTKSENYGYSGGDLTVLLIVLGDGFSPRFNLRSRS
jgi:hypothetical protein